MQACYFQKEFLLIGYKTINHFMFFFDVGVGALMFLREMPTLDLIFFVSRGQPSRETIHQDFLELATLHFRRQLLCLLHKQWLEEEEVKITTFVFIPVLPTKVKTWAA